MALQAPNLDDRKFQDIVSEARSKIAIYCPKWTDHNLSDPGITIIELFAWMVDMLLYRLNQVPEKNYIKFMDLMGIRLQPPKTATVNVTFHLSAQQPEPVTIPRGTEVATVRTDTQDAISFTTDEDVTILIPTLAYALTTPDESIYDDIMPELKNPYRETTIFNDLSQKNNALYLGYREDLAAHALALTIQSSIEGIGVDPNNPPWAWEFWDGEKENWAPVRLESDTTGGLNTSGQIMIHIPRASKNREVNNRAACWIRCRATEPLPEQGEYSRSPVVRSIVTESIGCTVQASHGSLITDELLGESDGTPGQRFQLQNTPVLPRIQGETIEVEKDEEGEYETWHEVGDFADSGPNDSHFTCDSLSGEIQFGPSIRQPSGEERQYGSIPPAGRRIRFVSYRSGGGVIGNVGKETITVLKSSIPYLASVTNFEAAKGGTNAEALESAKFRAPQVVKANIRAVTAEDFEYLALESSPQIARAKCISRGDSVGTQNIPPGMVRLLLVPSVTDSDGYIDSEKLLLPQRVLEEVQSYLDERRLLATRLEVTTPEYVSITVVSQVKAKAGTNHQQVAADVERRLCRYINPLIGGPTGKGWPFGRSLSTSEVYAIIQGIADVDYIDEISLFKVQEGERQEAATTISIPADSLLCSFGHEVFVV